MSSRSLFHDYLADRSEVLGFFQGSARALMTMPMQNRPWPEGIVTGTRAYNHAIGGEATFSGNEPTILTGQQPGLLTGPLYTIYKAITAIRLARKLGEQSGTRCVPVFWVGSEDHDFEETRTTHILTKSDLPLALTYTPDADIRNLPMNRIPIEDSLHLLVDKAASETRGSEFRTEVATFLHEALDASVSFADWTARIMARLFRGTELVFFAPHIKEARREAAAVMARAVRDPLSVTQLVNNTGDDLAALGYDVQVRKNTHECAFFLDIDERRSKVVFREGRFEVGDPVRHFSQEELLNILQREPERFSPNVTLRPIVQQRLFPVAAYVGGPGEIAYWAQLKDVFALFDETMPYVYPRANALLTTLKWNKLRDTCGVTLDDLMGPPDALLDKALLQNEVSPALCEIRTRRERIEQETSALADALAKQGAQAGDMARDFAQTVTGSLDRLERAAALANAAQTDAMRARLERLGNVLAPSRKPQERVYTVFSFVFEHGWDLVPRLLETLDIESFAMNEVEL